MIFNEFYIQKKIKDGDIREFEHLFAKYYQPLCVYAFGILKNMDTAEDLVQEFFYQFWKNREKFSPRISLNAYLYSSIKNNAVHHQQRQAMKEEYAKNLQVEKQNEYSDSSVDYLELNELGKIVQHTLQQMPERCAKVFRMSRFEGKKYQEIAELLSVSIKTVEADMGKALYIFRKSLNEYNTK